VVAQVDEADLLEGVVDGAGGSLPVGGGAVQELGEVYYGDGHGRLALIARSRSGWIVAQGR
jgi:hypothetical protein